MQADAPYSNFKVGASFLETGTVVCGNNQENAAYPSGLCAERIVFSLPAQTILSKISSNCNSYSN